MKRIHSIGMLIFVLFCCMGCNNAKKIVVNQTSTTELFGKEWHLTNLVGESVSATSNAVLQFSEDAVSKVIGNTGCNRLNGKVDLSGTATMKFSPLAVTRMACLDDQVAALEKKFLEALPKVDNWKIESGCLLLSQGEKLLVTLSPDPVASPTNASAHELNGSWELVYMAGANTELDQLFPQKKPVLVFSLPKASVSGNGGCNGFSSELKLNENKISFGDPLSTMMACEGNGEPVFFRTLKKINAYAINDYNTLTLIMGDIALMRLKRIK